MTPCDAWGLLGAKYHSPGFVFLRNVPFVMTFVLQLWFVLTVLHYYIYGSGKVAGTCVYGEGLSGSINAGNFLTSCKVYWLASQVGLCSME